MLSIHAKKYFCVALSVERALRLLHEVAAAEERLGGGGRGGLLRRGAGGHPVRELLGPLARALHELGVLRARLAELHPGFHLGVVARRLVLRDDVRGDQRRRADEDDRAEQVLERW
jgi:hypothetical protein